MSDIVSNSKLLSPLYFWLMYSIITIVIFEFGPLQFPVENKLILYLYLFGAHISIALGYYSGFSKFKGLKQEKLKLNLISKRWLKIISFIVLIGIIFSFFRDYLSGVSISAAGEDAFEAREVFTKERSGGVLGYIGAFFNVFELPYLAIGALNFKKLNFSPKSVFLLLIFRIAYEAAVGSSRHGIMLLIVILFFSFLALQYTNQIKISLKLFFTMTICSIMVFLTYSSYISLNRQVNPIEDYTSYMATNTKYEFKEDSIFIPKFSGDLQLINAGILTGYFYYTHAYHGLSNALNLPFKGTTLIFGHSDFSIRNLARVFGEEVLDYSYHYRLISENQHTSSLWITAYTWIASDVTFIGSFFLLYFFGSLFAKSWIGVLKSPTMISCSLFGWMAYFFFQINITFVPASLGTFISFWGVIILYKFTLKK
jgi:hypothetical protein